MKVFKLSSISVVPVPGVQNMGCPDLSSDVDLCIKHHNSSQWLDKKNLEILSFQGKFLNIFLAFHYHQHKVSPSRCCKRGYKHLHLLI